MELSSRAAHCEGCHESPEGPGARVNTVCSATVFRPAVVDDLRMTIREDHVVAR
ncbi:hypothetical protein [Nonomuraea fuscirosea]|uniref:hypothetical protein n=1 Tax=Nonomuraea fuscirosea TaxID=1291556 RepID=UPI0033D04BB6